VVDFGTSAAARATTALPRARRSDAWIDIRSRVGGRADACRVDRIADRDRPSRDRRRTRNRSAPDGADR